MSIKQKVTSDLNTQNELWEFVGHTIVALGLWVGIGYLVGGNHTAPGISYYILKKAPAGMRLHGAIMCLLAVSLLVMIHRTKWDNLSRWVFRIFSFYGFFIGSTFFGSWYLTKQISWGGPGWWFAIAVLAQGMVIYPPAREIPSEKDLSGKGLEGDSIWHSR